MRRDLRSEQLAVSNASTFVYFPFEPLLIVAQPVLGDLVCLSLRCCLFRLRLFLSLEDLSGFFQFPSLQSELRALDEDG